MYPLTGKEKVRELEEFPDPGLPSDYGGPIIFATEHRAVIGYQIALSEEGLRWKPENSEFDLGGQGERFLIMKIESPVFLVHTPYNQEGLGRHPLASVGLKWNSVFMIENSFFNMEHSYLSKEHYVFQFEDSTLDLVCRKIGDMFLFRGTVESTTDKISKIFGENA